MGSQDFWQTTLQLVILHRMKQVLKKLRNIDNLNDWCEKWLLKLNSIKTDIMIFSKNIKPDFAFDFGGVSIAPVDTHKHLGVTFRSDCKWNNHVDILIEKTSKQVNAFRKLKFQLKVVPNT